MSRTAERRFSGRPFCSRRRQPVKFELTDQTREAVEAQIAKMQLAFGQFLFPSRINGSPHDREIMGGEDRLSFYRSSRTLIKTTM